MTTTITWSAVIDGCTAPCVERRMTEIISFVPPTGADAAATAFKWWLEEDDTEEPYHTNWQSHVGEDGETEVAALVMINAPADMAGLYEVRAERKISADGYTAEPANHTAAVALLDAAAETEVA